MDNSLTSRPPGLLKLPAELLYQVFDDVYMNWSEVEPTSRKSERPLTSPLSRALVGYQRQGLYRSVTVTKGTAMVQFFKAILSQPQLAIHTTSLAIKISSMRLRSTLEVLSPEVLKKCFSSFQNLRHLSLRDHTTILFPALLSILTSDTLSPKCLSVSLSLPYPPQDVLLSLPLKLERCILEMVQWQIPGAVEKEDQVSRPPFSNLSSLTLSRIRTYHQSDKTWSDFLARCPALHHLTLHEMNCDGIRELGIVGSPVLGSITKLSLLGGAHRNGQGIDFASFLPRFSNLRELTLAVNLCHNLYDPFFDAVRKLPLETLIFGTFEDPPLACLQALVSPPSQHLTLRTLTLNGVDRVGTVGTRISSLELPFHINDEPGSLLEDFFPEDWDVPTIPLDYSVEGLKALQLAGEKNEVSIDGRVFRASEVRAAYEQDVALLQERWENWRKRGKKAKGKKGKRVKKGKK
ncbi:hypothetical protein JCM3765_007709 [Sporobolomyces pararoseus]